MKTIGLIGGMSWQSSIEYYRIVNEESQKLLGGFHTCKSMMYTVDFGPIQQFQDDDNWDRLSEIMVEAAKTVEKSGADFVLICANTMHKTADDVEKAISIPLIHIADATGEAIVDKGLKKVALLGTPFTMEQDFYKGRLNVKFGLDVLTPQEKNDRDAIYDIINNELSFGVLKDSSRARFLNIMDKLAQQGAEGIILGCTEIPLLVKQEHTKIPVFDPTRIHATKAVKVALA